MTTPPARLGGLDLVRGVMLVASVAVDSLFTEPDWFAHAVWDGVHPVDLILPVFVTLTGCGLGLALHRRVTVAPLLRRVLVLLLVGLVYNAIALSSWRGETWWFTGVLQLYAGVVGVIGLLHLITRRCWGWMVITVLLAGGCTTVLAVWAAGCPGLEIAPECNPSGVIDPAVFGAVHVYHQGAAGHDPVGLVELLRALVSASAGATVGYLLRAIRQGGSGRRRGVAAAVLPLVAVAVAVAVATVLLAQLRLVVPPLLGSAEPLVMKRLWTPPFALRVAAGTALALLAGHLILDRRRIGPDVRFTSGRSWRSGATASWCISGRTLMSILTRPDAESSSWRSTSRGGSPWAARCSSRGRSRRWSSECWWRASCTGCTST